MRIKKTISIPQNEEYLIEKAKERCLVLGDEPVVADSQLFRIALQALLRIEPKILRECVEACPCPKPGLQNQNKRIRRKIAKTFPQATYDI
ncbi:MAG: hypothetical protein F6K58_10445 [Symploca sp. SIO2E9]|nr:hypothetical protein [Symploca sp. SIO2E9]